MVEIDIAKEEDASEEHCLRTTAMGCYESALRSSFALQGFPKNLVIDLQQRVLIAMARLSLGLSMMENMLYIKRVYRVTLNTLIICWMWWMVLS
jgi:hypothetical protein